MGCQTEYRSIARSGEEKVANWPSYWRHGERGRVKRSSQKKRESYCKKMKKVIGEPGRVKQSSQKKREKVIAQKRKLLRESYCAKKEVIERKLLHKKGSYWEKVILQKKEKSYWQACPPQTIDHLKKRGKLIGTPGSRDHHGKSYRPREIIRTEKEKQADVTGRLIIDQSTKSCPWSLRPAQRLSIHHSDNQKSRLSISSFIIETSSASQHLMIERISAGTLICTFVELNWRYVSLLMSFDFHTKYIFGYILISFVVYI